MAEAVTVEIDAQYRQLREECGVLDRSDRGKLLVTGSEAAEYLQGQLTNDIEALAPGEGCYAALLDRKGHMQADMRVLVVDGEKIWIDTEPEALAAARRHLEMYKIGRDADVEDAERRAGDRLADRAAQRRARRLLPRSPSTATKRSRSTASSAPRSARALGIDLIPRADGSRAPDRAPWPRPARPPSIPSAAEILRIESGTPRFGSEMDTATMPAEAGIVAAAVNFEKGCYIGQETVARLHYKGKPNRHLRGLRLSAPAAPRGDALRLARRRSASSAAAASPPPTDRSGWRSCGARPSPAPSCS